MRICVFSDIHGNGHAFRQAMKMMKREGADLYLFLGDLCGYYFDQAEIFDGLRSLPNLTALRGNHDQMFLDILGGDSVLRDEYRRSYGKSMDFLILKDCQDLACWLSALPISSVSIAPGIAAFHGSPGNPLEGYIYPDSPLEGFLDEVPSFFFLGHTHYPMARYMGEKRIINPGSLGQPRNGGWPSYAMIDGFHGTVKFREVQYDKELLLKDIDKLDSDNRYLKDILFRHA